MRDASAPELSLRDRESPVPAGAGLPGLEPPPSPRSLGLGRTFAALRHRNYRLWFAGQLVSLMGTWMQITAQGYLVYELTRSAAYLGYVGFVSGLPSWLFMLYGGVVADRVPRRTLLIATQAVMMALAIVLSVLAFTGAVAPWHVLALTFLLGVANAFDAPARQAFVLEMVGREDLTNAIALNSSMFNCATAVGPAVAGLAYTTLGPGGCFAINAASFLAVIVALLAMRVSPAPAERRGSTLGALREGLRYVAGQPAIRAIMGVMVATSIFGISFVTLVPAWAVKILGGDAATNGFLQAARGIGALLAALTIASMGNVRRKGRWLTAGSLLYPTLLLAFTLVRWLPVSLLLLVGVGFGMMMLFNMANALVQSLVPDELRGRVMSIYTFSFFGFMPLGSLAAGAVAHRIGEPATVAAGAAISLALGLLVFWRVPRMRRLE